jgi:hypothetical protein
LSTNQTQSRQNQEKSQQKTNTNLSHNRANFRIENQKLFSFDFGGGHNKPPPSCCTTLLAGGAALFFSPDFLSPAFNKKRRKGKERRNLFNYKRKAAGDSTERQ